MFLNRLTKITAALTFSIALMAQSAVAQTFLTEKELLATFPGATIYGVSSGDGKTKWAAAYSKGGKRGNISGIWGDGTYKSKWSVKGDKLCEKSKSFDACFTIERVGAKKLQAYKHGTDKLKNLWYIK